MSEALPTPNADKYAKTLKVKRRVVVTIFELEEARADGSDVVLALDHDPPLASEEIPQTPAYLALRRMLLAMHQANDAKVQYRAQKIKPAGKGQITKLPEKTKDLLKGKRRPK